LRESKYMDWKARAEDKMLANFPYVNIVRAPILFGNGNYLFNQRSPIAFYPSKALEAKHQPMFIDDFIEGIKRILEDEDKKFMHVFEFGGPKEYTLKEMLKAANRVYRNQLVIKAPFWVGDVLVGLRQMLPERPGVTREIYSACEYDLVPNPDRHLMTEIFTIEDLGMKKEELKSLEDLKPEER
jgi:nucleoside-diphosphate-sugar epimerase